MRQITARRLLLSTGLAGMALIALPALAQAQSTNTSISTVSGLLSAGYNTYVEDNMGSAGAAYTSDSQSAIAVGGNAYLSNFGTSTNSTANGVGLAVGGNLSMTSGSVNGTTTVAGNLASTNTGFNSVSTGGNISYSSGYISGNVSAGGSATLSGVGVGGSIAAGGPVILNGSVTPASAPAAYSAPINFAATTANLQSVSSAFATMTATAGDTMTQTGYSTVFTATHAGTNVFDVTAAQLSAMSGSQVTFNSTVAGATDVINITDSGNVALPSNMSFAYTGTMTDNKVLLNANSATTLTMGSGVSYDLSVMAPNATLVTNSNGNFTGTVMVENLTGGAQLNLANSGTTTQVAMPAASPAPLPMAGTTPVALLLIGWFRRRDVKRIAGQLLSR